MIRASHGRPDLELGDQLLPRLPYWQVLLSIARVLLKSLECYIRSFVRLCRSAAAFLNLPSLRIVHLALLFTLVRCLPIDPMSACGLSFSIPTQCADSTVDSFRVNLTARLKFDHVELFMIRQHCTFLLGGETLDALLM